MLVKAYTVSRPVLGVGGFRARRGPGTVNATAFLLDNLSYVFRAVQNGLVQSYALGMLIGVFLLIAAGHWILGLY